MKLSVATTARREIPHKPKQKTLLRKQLGKTQWSNTIGGISLLPADDNGGGSYIGAARLPLWY